jgi:manganese/zinc/iron transport system substrate-binding protein
VKNAERTYWCLLGFCIIIVYQACAGEKTQVGNKQLKVLVSHSILAEPIQFVFGEEATIDVLIPVGVDPHTFRPLPGDLMRWEQADILIAQGMQFEGGMQKMFDGISKRKKVLLLEHYVPEDSLLLMSGELKDPHLWFDPPLWRMCISPLIKELANSFSLANENEWNKRLTEWENGVEGIHARLKGSLAGKKDFFISEHMAFGYLARRYGIQFSSVRGNTPHAEFGLFRLRNLISSAHTNRSAEGALILVSEAGISGRGLRRLNEILRTRGVEFTQTRPLYTDALAAHHTGYSMFMEELAEVLGETSNPLVYVR